MKHEYQKIQKGCGFVYSCANMLYRRVKTEGNVKYLTDSQTDRQTDGHSSLYLEPPFGGESSYKFGGS